MFLVSLAEGFIHLFQAAGKIFLDMMTGLIPMLICLLLAINWHCCKVSDEAAFCLIQRPYISKTLLTRRISPRGSP